ncbi:hypothetical protein F4677DRAFT_432369 [Hypoxylon crocopeplum]|nr:hypothetical protein F4677DRAFT_432369 [Hypoxylon crocopeplum]
MKPDQAPEERLNDLSRCSPTYYLIIQEEKRKQAMPQSIKNFNRGQNVAEDIHSMGTVSSSDTKSYDSIFSSGNPQLVPHSSRHTTPLHSRPSSPDSGHAKTIDADLRGIGLLATSSTSGSLKVTPSGLTEQHKPLQVNNAVNFHSLGSSPFPSLVAMQPGKSDTVMDYTNRLVPTPDKVSPAGCSPDASLLSRALTKSSSPDAWVIHEDSSSSGTNSEDDDLDLEKSADEAMSTWFGISLSRLVRPVRVIYAFEQVKKQCAGILQDEGHYIPNEESYQDDEGNQDVQMDPYDAGEGSRSAGSNRLPDSKSSTPFSSNRKQSRGRTFQSSSSSEQRVKIRGSYQRHQVGGELCCPYRKRNPIRFNVRDYEKCANKSYPDMSQLKKHLTSVHFKSDSASRTCTRCNRPFPPGFNMLVHYEQCPYPPQPRTNYQNTDPEDGFNEMVDNRLRSRGANKIEEWADLYKHLFPDDEIIPEPDFIPVVEDHEVFHKYESTKSALIQRVDEVVAQHLFNSAFNRSRLVTDILVIFDNTLTVVLGRSELIRPNFQTRQGRFDSEYSEPQSLEDDSGGASGSADSYPTTGIFDTPRYISPANSPGEPQGDPAQFSSSSQDMDLSRLDSAPPPATLDARQNQFLAEENGQLQIDSQFSNSYIGQPGMYSNFTDAAVESVPWLLPFRDTMSLPGDIQALSIDDFSATPGFVWFPGGDHEFPANYTQQHHDPNQMF